MLTLPPVQPVASPGSHLYLPSSTAGELRALAPAASEIDLQPEVDLVRIVLRRLLSFLDESAGELSPEETRRVAGLVFTGARTIAMLQGKRAAHPTEAHEWLSAALGEMGAKYNFDL